MQKLKILTIIVFPAELDAALQEMEIINNNKPNNTLTDAVTHIYKLEGVL